MMMMLTPFPWAQTKSQIDWWWFYSELVHQVNRQTPSFFLWFFIFIFFTFHFHFYWFLETGYLPIPKAASLVVYLHSTLWCSGLVIATLCHHMEKIDIMWNCAASYHIMPHYAALPRIMPHGENWKYTAKLKLCHSMPHYATLCRSMEKIEIIPQNWNEIVR